MKINILTLTLGLFLFAANSFAGSTVCSGENLYVSSLRADLGAVPGPGTVIGKHVYVLNGSVVLSYEDRFGMNRQGVPPYDLSLEEERVIEETGTRTAGSRVSIATGVLYEVNPMDSTDREEVAREIVTCRTAWAMVP